MTHIVPSHRLGNRAVLAVCTVLDRAGALAETIKNDYGEDLLVQTQLRDVADNFQILIQVKGSRLKKGRNGHFSFRVDALHLRRWASHMQPVLVCVFNESTGKIFAFSPRERFSLWDLSMTDKKHIAIKFAETDVFDEFSAMKYIWRCRIEHFSRMLAWYENNHRYITEYDNLGYKGTSAESEGIIVVFNFLRSLGIFSENSFEPGFIKKDR